jgi:type I restriction enzyme S subunit
MSHYKRYPKYKDSSVGWLSKVPEHWNQERIFANFSEVDVRGGEQSELLAVSQGYGVMPQKEYEELLGRRLSAQEKGDYSKYKRVQAGDLVYNKMRMWQGAIGVAPCEGIVSPAYVTFRSNDGFTPEYWYRMFKGSSFLVEVNRNSQGICDDQNSCNYDDFRTIRVPVPPTAEQADIVEALLPETTRIDALIEKKTRFIELLKEKRQALITQAVTKGLDPNVKMKDSGVEWLGDVPEHWDVKRMRFVGAYLNSNVDKKSYEGQELVRLCNYTDVYYSEFIHNDPNFMVASASPAEIERFQLMKGDVIITKDSEDPTDIGIPALVPEDLEGVVCGYHLTVLRTGDYQTSRFLHRLVQSHATKAHFYVEAPGITRFGLGQDAIGSIPIPLPEPAELADIADYIEAETTRIDTLIEKSIKSIALLKERRSALITAAVTGQIDLRDAA